MSYQEQTYEDFDGQITFNPISTNLSNYVVMDNNLIFGRQNLSINEIKLTRLIMMQIVAEDMNFRFYEVSPADFSRIIGHSNASNLYHCAEDLCVGLMQKHVEVKAADGSWEKINWVSVCRYNAKNKKIEIKLNPDLAPLLLGLVKKGFYTQYPMETISGMTSVYAIRIFELLLASIKTKTLPPNGTRVEISRQDIVDACMLYKYDSKGKVLIDQETKRPVEKYPKMCHIKNRVIAYACKEICENTNYYVPFESEGDPDKCVKNIKKGKEIVAFSFYVNMKYHENDHPPKPRLGSVQIVA